MSKRQASRPGGAIPRRRRDDYRVGKNRPPPEHRFKPGQSGNPKGRPKGRKNNSTILREILDRKLQVAVNGRMRSVSVREVMLTRFADAALKGDIKSAMFLLHRDDAAAGADQTPQQSEAAPDEQEIIDSYLKSHLARSAKK